MIRFATVLLMITASCALLAGSARSADAHTSAQYAAEGSWDLVQQDGTCASDDGTGWSFQIRKYKPRSTEPVRVVSLMPERHMQICFTENRSTARRITSLIERSRRNVPARRLEHLYLTEEQKIGAVNINILGIFTA